MQNKRQRKFPPNSTQALSEIYMVYPINSDTTNTHVHFVHADALPRHLEHAGVSVCALLREAEAISRPRTTSPVR